MRVAPPNRRRIIVQPQSCKAGKSQNRKPGNPEIRKSGSAEKRLCASAGVRRIRPRTCPRIRSTRDRAGRDRPRSKGRPDRAGRRSGADRSRRGCPGSRCEWRCRPTRRRPRPRDPDRACAASDRRNGTGNRCRRFWAAADIYPQALPQMRYCFATFGGDDSAQWRSNHSKGRLNELSI